jgi:hypothetical protein
MARIKKRHERHIHPTQAQMKIHHAGNAPVRLQRLFGRVALCMTLSISMGHAVGGEPPAPKGSFLADKYSKPTNNLLTWPRARADEFGCFMEKSYGVHDPRFNCGLKSYKNKGDPCKNTVAYYEGPQFPDRPGLVQPLAMGVELSWEHGRLQAFTITLMGKMTGSQARQALNLPPPDVEDLPPNVMGIDVQYPSNITTAVTVTSFDHMGAGDVDCDGAESR